MTIPMQYQSIARNAMKRRRSSHSKSALKEYLFTFNLLIKRYSSCARERTEPVSRPDK